MALYPVQIFANISDVGHMGEIGSHWTWKELVNYLTPILGFAPNEVTCDGIPWEKEDNGETRLLGEVWTVYKGKFIEEPGQAEKKNGKALYCMERCKPTMGNCRTIVSYVLKIVMSSAVSIM